MQSTLWAGPESISRSVKRGEHPVQGTVREQPVSLLLGFASEEFGYLIDLGLPAPGTTAFGLDPIIKRECIWHGPTLRPSSLLTDRQGHCVRVRLADDTWSTVTDNLSLFDTMMTHVADPRNAPEMLALRECIRAWRFYDHFRTDAEAPARSPQVGTYTPILCDDGADVAAAIQTIRLFGDSAGLDSTVDDAFPGSKLAVVDDSGRFILVMQQHGLLRPLRAAELSDGTLRYMLWIAALLTTRPPPLMVLNEPETSLHPSLIPALARLIVRASASSQIIIVTHASQLIDALNKHADCHSIELEKSFGESVIIGTKETGLPPWHWPTR